MDEMNPAVKQEENIEPAAIKPGTPRWYEGHISLEDAKTFIRANITTAARSFIAIGFYLKCVRDRELFLEEEYSDVWEFAKSEYGISKSTASRYMSMNDRFSENGNSPNIKEEYRTFGKSQLQEMLYLEDEQLEQVRPDNRVEDIRNLRRLKEIPYVALPGQMEIEIDFPEILPEEQAEPEMLQKQTFEMNVEELLADEGQEGIAISQQSEEEQGIDHFFDRNESIDDAYGWSRSEMVKEYLRTGYTNPDKECEISVFGDTNKVVKGERVTVFYNASETYSFDVENTRLEREYNFFFGNQKPESKELETVIETPETVSEQPESVPDCPETVIDGEFVEVPPEPEPQDFTPRYFLAEQSRMLDEYLQLSAEYRAEPAIRLMEVRQKTIVAALSAMVAELEKPEPVKQAQPELPLLKNNDQRAAFVDAYETWPLWVETEETGERYYRYDLSDKVVMVVKVSRKRAWRDYYKETKDYEYGAEQYYLLGIKSQWSKGKNVSVEDDSRTFYECNANRSALIDYLKEFQKKQKGDKG